VNVTGATASAYTINPTTLAMNTNTFRVVVTGLCTTINSGAATLFVNPLPTITLNASPHFSLLPTQSTSIIASANPSGGSFAWTLNNNPIGNTTGPVLGPLTVSEAGTYNTVYTDLNGCTVASSPLTITAQASENLWVYPNPNNGQFSIRFFNQTGERATVKLFNPFGQIVYQQEAALGLAYTTINVNLTNIPPGIYIVKVFGSGGTVVAGKQIAIYK
jgi:hypothetical protein